MNRRIMGSSQWIVNLLGVIGYSLLVVSYVSLTVAGIAWLVGGDISLITSRPDTGVAQEQALGVPAPEADDTPSPMMIIATSATMVLTTVVSAFVLFALPYWLGKSGSFLVKRSIQLCQWPVTPVSLFIAKCIACAAITPPILVIGAYDTSSLFSFMPIIALAVTSLVAFILQHYFAKLARLEAKSIW